MREWGADPAEYDLIIEYLEEENFLNEARFARAFAGGKFRVKRWGRHKIRNELRKRNIDSRLIERAFIREIPDEAYLNTLEYLMSKRVNFDGDLISLEERQKLFKYLQQKGYEWDLIQAVWKNNKGDNP
jgi:regulatory protein